MADGLNLKLESLCSQLLMPLESAHLVFLCDLLWLSTRYVVDKFVGQ